MGQFNELLVLCYHTCKKDTSGQNRSDVKLFKDDYSICGFSRNSKEVRSVLPISNSAQQLRTLGRRTRQRKGEIPPVSFQLHDFIKLPKVLKADL